MPKAKKLRTSRKYTPVPFRSSSNAQSVFTPGKSHILNHSGPGNTRCYICISNRSSIISCISCPRAICSNCISIPEVATTQSYAFFCLRCHEQWFGSQPYTGFYRQNNALPPLVDGSINNKAFNPIQASPVKVNNRFQITANSRVCNEGLAIVQLLPVGAKPEGSPAKILAEYMSTFIDDKALFYKEVLFDFSSDGSICSHAQKMKDMVGGMVARNWKKGRVVIFISAGSGLRDLFASTGDFLEALLPDDVFPVDIEATVWMLSSIYPEAQNDVLDSVRRLRLSRAIVFTATELQPCLIAPLILSYALHVLVAGLAFDVFERLFLPLFPAICRNTDIIHIFQKDGKPRVLQYIWTHRIIRPWGNFLPVQCQRCYRIRPWESVNSDSSCLFACRGCPNKLKFVAPSNIKWLGDEVSGGRWMVAA